jgi:signal transduction histidine kinase
MAQLEFAGELFAALAVELCAHPDDLRRLIDRVETVAGIPRVALGREVLRAPQLLQLPTGVAIEVQLTLLLAFANANSASLWTLDEAETLEQIAHAGQADLDPGETRRLAQTLLAGEAAARSGDHAVPGILVDRSPQSPVALIACGGAGSAADRGLLLDAAVAILTAVFAREELLTSRAPQTGSSLTERRLSRLRFDLHDGPQQDVIMLAEDVRFFGEQLGAVIEDAANRDRALGRIDDLQARLVALDGDMRRISAALESPFSQHEALPDAIAQLAQAFTARTHVAPTIELKGEFTRLTDSQQIALLALIREALANIREHSHAEHVTISLSAGPHGVEATVIDDGHGFDPETALINAAREGHLGLVGMYERIRLLGGQTTIDSRPGGPTVISVTLPAWPAVDAPPAESGDGSG